MCISTKSIKNVQNIVSNTRQFFFLLPSNTFMTVRATRLSCGWALNLLDTGTSKAQIFTFYIVLDKKLVPCQSCTSLGAFDELCKSHFVFIVKYYDSLSSLYTFLQTAVYNIDKGRTEETPRVKELRARLLNKL